MSSSSKSSSYAPAEVYVRIRPFADSGYHGKEKIENGSIPSNHKKIHSFTEDSITLTDQSNRKQDLFKYPKAIVKPETNQTDAFKQMKLPEKIDYFIKGHNCTAIAYGQTGSGKTHTMFGPPSLAKEIRKMGDVDISQENTFPKEWGLFARTILSIIKEMEKLKSGGAEFYFAATIIEIYFMQVYDLLNNKQKIPTSPYQGGEFDYGKAKEKKIETLNDVAELAQIIITKRASRGTSCNDTSSRSHCICTLSLVCVTKEDSGEKFVRRNEFTFADLSGSEKIEKTEHSTSSMAGWEGMAINWDLHQFGKTVLHMAEQQRRNRRRGTKKSVLKNYSSLLARLLAGCIEGESFACMIVCLSQSDNNGNESRNSLLFGENFSKIVPPVPPIQRKINLKVKLKKAEKALKEQENALKTVHKSNPFYLKRMAARESLKTEIEFLGKFK